MGDTKGGKYIENEQRQKQKDERLKKCGMEWKGLKD